MAEGLSEASADIADVDRRDLNEVRSKIELLGQNFLSINEDLNKQRNVPLIF